MAWADRIIGVVIVAVCLPLWHQADKFPSGGGAFPKAVIAAVALFAVILIIRSFFAGAKSRGEGINDSKTWVMASLLTIATTASVIAMGVVGYFPAMIALAGVLFFLLGGKTRLLYLSSVACTLISIFIVFVLLLHVPLDSPIF